jgi:hypothetical protein
MNKKACLILLAFAAQQSSMMASWNWKKQNTQSTDQASVPTPTTPAIVISGSLSDNPEYRANMQAQLRQILAQGKRASVDISNLETTIITEHATKMIEPGMKALKEVEEKSEQEIAELRSKNEKLVDQILWTQRRTMMAAITALVIGGAIGHYTK